MSRKITQEEKDAFTNLLETMERIGISENKTKKFSLEVGSSDTLNDCLWTGYKIRIRLIESLCLSRGLSFDTIPRIVNIIRQVRKKGFLQEEEYKRFQELGIKFDIVDNQLSYDDFIEMLIFMTDRVFTKKDFEDSIRTWDDLIQEPETF